MTKFQTKEQYLVLAGGRIRCHRCQAVSKRTGLQCSAPSMRSAGRAVCYRHGGASTGPRSEAGKRKIAAAQLKHGLHSKSAIAQRQEIAARLAMLEDAMHVLEMTNAPRTRGRKPRLYEPVMSAADFIRVFGIGCDRADDDDQ